MLYILCIGIGMAIISAVFWCVEAIPFVKKLIELNKSGRGGWSYTWRLIAILPKLFPLFLDICCTVWLAGAFAFSGMIGGVIGLTISNVISIFILIVAKKSSPQKEKSK